MAAGAGALRAAIASHLGSRQVSRVIYGAIIGLALVVVLESHRARVGVAIGSLLATAAAVALAEVYSEVIGTETRMRHRIRRAELAHIAGDVAAVALGVAFPCAFLLAAAVGVLDADVAYALAKWSGLGLIGTYGFVAARFAGAATGSALLHAGAVALAGGLLIAVKALLH